MTLVHSTLNATVNEQYDCILKKFQKVVFVI